MKKFKQWGVGRVLAVLLAIVSLAVAIALPVAATPALAAEADGTSPGQTASENIWTNGYAWNWGQIVTSHIEATSDGGYDRVEWTDNALHVEHYDSKFSFVSGQTIDASTYTPTGASDVYWGGYFKGSQYRFVVTGQKNPNQSDEVAVVRVTKYSMDWKYLASIEYSGINVYEPFHFGSLRMTESNGELWIRTCHTMYGEIHHQANMTFRIRESDLAKLGSETSSENDDSFGYASHSFNQYIIASGGKIYAADHGDAYPRMILAWDISPSLGGRIKSYELVSFKGETGDNYTGATLDGFESANDGASLIAVGTLADQDKTFANSGSDDESGSRNVWIGVVSTADGSVTIKDITSYAFDDADTADSPVLVKLNENKFLLMWSTVKKDDYTFGPVQYAFVDAAGNLTSGISSFDGSLSDCHPVVVGNDVVWYSTGVWRKGEYDNAERVASAPTFYSLDTTTGKVTSKKPSVPMYRLYNQWSGEHLFTLSKDEVNSLTGIGWKYEGVAWQSPVGSNSPVYRLYNPYSGDHFYTSSWDEYSSLGRIGWNQEGISFYSADASTGKPIYRLFNRWLTQGTHLFTTSADEYQYLGSIGWNQERIAFYSL